MAATLPGRADTLRFPRHGRLPIPARAGVGLRHPHVTGFLRERPAVGWLEVHTENYMSAGGPRRAALERLRSDYPLSCHGVGLSLGSAEGLDEDHLARVAEVVDRFEPDLVSEHVAWSVHGGAYLNDLLPLPYTEEALGVISANIDRMQTALDRQVLVENPSSYVRFAASTMAEWQFMAEIVARTGCGLLLDVNNIHVSAHNHRFDAEAYVDALPLDAVQEIHVAGHFIQHFVDADGAPKTILIDDHGDHVSAPVWRLFEAALARLGPVPTLVEWDANIPDLTVLLAEARKADALLRAVTPAERRTGSEAAHVA
ncbi:MAG: DUF692 domain-containing protein [Azospirillaceae bacterium]